MLHLVQDGEHVVGYLTNRLLGQQLEFDQHVIGTYQYPNIELIAEEDPGGMDPIRATVLQNGAVLLLRGFGDEGVELIRATE